MARNMITGKETQKMQEFTQEQMDCRFIQCCFDIVSVSSD